MIWTSHPYLFDDLMIHWKVTKSYFIKLADQFEMSLEELYMKVTNDHLPLGVRQLLPNPIYGYTNSEFSEDWQQFEKVGEDQPETVKV